MFAKQISVFVENSAGKLAEFTGLLARNGIDLISMTIADTSSFGILRFITGPWEKAVSVIEQAGYTARVNHVPVIPVEDKPGGLARVLAILEQKGIDVEYMYSFNRTWEGKALIAIRVSDNALAEEAFRENGIPMIGQDMLCRM